MGGGAEEDGQVSIFSQAKSMANSRKRVPAAVAASSQAAEDVRSKTSAQSRLSLAFISQRGK